MKLDENCMCSKLYSETK